MNRVSDISSPADIALEQLREDLRDRRSQRRQAELLTFVHALRVLAGTIGIASMVVWLNHLLEIVRL